MNINTYTFRLTCLTAAVKLVIENRKKKLKLNKKNYKLKNTVWLLYVYKALVWLKKKKIKRNQKKKITL